MEPLFWAQKHLHQLSSTCFSGDWAQLCGALPLSLLKNSNVILCSVNLRGGSFFLWFPPHDTLEFSFHPLCYLVSNFMLTNYLHWFFSSVSWLDPGWFHTSLVLTSIEIASSWASFCYIDYFSVYSANGSSSFQAYQLPVIQGTVLPSLLLSSLPTLTSLSWWWCHPCLLLLLSHFSRVRLCATPETAAHQALPSLGFSRQEHWSGLPFPSPVHESEKWKWSCSVVSDSSRPHGLQPTRLLCPWDFPGKSTGVGCRCLLRHPCLQL